MKCPVDDAILTMSERNGIEIDYCPTCRGVWLDRGELDKMIDRAAESPARPSQAEVRSYDEPRRTHVSEHGYEPERRRDFDDDDYRKNQPYTHKKKRESFLGDLFDF